MFLGTSSLSGDDGSLDDSFGLWIRDSGAFLRKIFATVERNSACLIVTVKHMGHDLTDQGNIVK